MAIARIFGPLLASNLVRTQSDLKFETDLLHIGSSNTRIGVRTDSPTDLLQINGQVKIIDPYATRLTGGNIEINTNGARAVVGDINLDSQANISAEEINTEKYEQLIKNGIIADGMIPKLYNCFNALEKGVGKVKIGNASLVNCSNKLYTTLSL